MEPFILFIHITLSAPSFLVEKKVKLLCLAVTYKSCAWVGIPNATVCRRFFRWEASLRLHFTSTHSGRGWPKSSCSTYIRGEMEKAEVSASLRNDYLSLRSDKPNMVHGMLSGIYPRSKTTWIGSGSWRSLEPHITKSLFCFLAPFMVALVRSCH